VEPIDGASTAGPSYAPWGRRILSTVIDYFAVFFLSVPFLGSALSRVNDGIVEGKNLERADVTRVFVTFLIVIVVYSTALHGWRGSTLGKMAARTKLVMDDGSAVNWQVAFVRAVAFVGIMFASVFTVLPVFLIVDELRPLWHRQRQTWHDQVAHTVVVRA
jgi:uncharacterized RDD family membrane protein YckC